MADIGRAKDSGNGQTPQGRWNLQGFQGLRTALPLVGLSFWQAWWMLMSTTNLMCGPVQHAGRTIDIVMAATLVGYVVLMLAAPRMAPYSGTRTFAAAGAGCFAGSVLLSIATHLCLPFAVGCVLEIGGAVAMALCNALLLLMWGERWGTLASGDVGRQLCISFAFAFVLYFAVVSLPLLLAVALNALMAPLSAWALAISQNLPCRTEPVAPVKLKAHLSAAVLACIFAFSVAFGCVQRYAGYGGGGGEGAMLVAGGLIALFALVMIAFNASGDPFSFYRPIVPAVVCGILVCLMSFGSAPTWGNGILIAGIYCLDMFMMFSASDLAYRAKLPVALVFGAAIVSARAGTWLGSQFGSWLVAADNPLGADGVGNVVLALTCVVAIAGTVLFTESDLRTVYQPEAKPHVPDLDERCDQIAQSAGLSARELDVMRLLARGRSVAVISETLGIAQGTVKHHASNTYRKLGVYDRQGLIDVVAGDTDERSS